MSLATLYQGCWHCGCNTTFRALSCCDGLPGWISLDHPSSCPLKPSQLPPASSVTLSTWQQDTSGMRTSHLLLNAFPRLARTPGSSTVVRRARRHLAATCRLSSLRGSLWGPEIQHPSVISGWGALRPSVHTAPTGPAWLSSTGMLAAPPPPVFPPLRRLWMVCAQRCSAPDS